MSASSKKKLRKEQAAEGLTEKQRQEQKEAKKLKVYTAAFVIAMVLIVVIAISVPVGRAILNMGILEKNTTAATVGSHALNTVEMNYYFVNAVNAYYSQLYNTLGSSTDSYLQMMGLDLSKPLSAQTYNEESGETWADYFLDIALSNAKANYTLYDDAIANGYTLTEDDQASIDSSVSNTALTAVYSAGISNLDTYLRQIYGRGASEASYRDYLKVSVIAYSYNNQHQEGLTYDDAAIQAYDAEHADTFNAYSYASYFVSVSSFLTGGTTGEDGAVTYSDEERTAAQEAAKAAAEGLLKAETVEDLDEAIKAMEINKDSTSAASTKNDYVYFNSLPTAYKDWLTDSRREAGDKNVFPNETSSTNDDGSTTTTVNGYTVVFFQKMTDNDYALANVRHILIQFKSANNSTSYTDEEKQAAKDAAEALYKQWQDGEATEESFTALVADNTDDSGSKDNGGLYEDVVPGQMVEAFNDWCFAEGRKAGDSGLVETTYGWHLMYYVGDSDTSYRSYLVENAMRSEDQNEWYQGLLDKVTAAKGDTSRMSLDLVFRPASVS